jgi:membrane protein
MKIKDYWTLIKDTSNEFSNDNGSKLAASLAYSTIFAIGPLLLVLQALLGLFYTKSAANDELIRQLGSLIGQQSADQVRSIIDNIHTHSNHALFGIIGAVVLAFSATGIFTEIQGSINYVWSIRTKPKRGWLKYIINRLISFSLIVGMGFLLLVSLFVNVFIDIVSKRLFARFGNVDTILVQGANLLLLFVIIGLLFTIIYKVLPDARIHWKDAMIGAMLTSVLFLAGKFLIGYYLGTSNFTSTYGAAASIIILLSWVYYSSMILYFGAEFTKVYAMKFGKGIVVSDTAVYIEKVEAKETAHKVVPSEAQQKNTA